ncbi:PAS domain S-box protein [Thermocoleostomius sinensis]|uniref:Circadian input-output histidine kinase CikA n=1 Tax=Thermocoleostomius sinensis A174 TaxID=2016057 RepID=A0A9E8Z8S2_9CYAN|nr:PAS domain S-box protein [Thermocoleostomius sinensis]WAL58588.1 PAS domain S-box protein [Thermocoleostomius sinensis A174]
MLQTVGTVALVCYFCHRTTQATIEGLANELTQEVGDRIRLALEGYLKAPEQINQLNAAAIQDGSLDWTNLSQLEQHFVKQLQILPDASAITIATEQRKFLSIGKFNTTGLVIRRFDETTNNRLNYYSASTDGRIEQLQESQSEFDPHNHPPGKSWYAAVKASQHPTWRLLVSSAQGRNQPILKVAHFLPVYDRSNQFQGVVSSAFYLTQMGDFLGQLEIGQTGQAFIVDQAGFLVATSTGEVPFLRQINWGDAQQLDPERHRLRAIDSQDPVTRTAARWLLEPPAGQHRERWRGVEPTSSSIPSSSLELPQASHFTFDRQRYFLHVTPLRHDNQLNWTIVTVVPEADFTGTIAQNTENAVFISAMTLLLSMALSAYLAQWITRPITRLNAAAKRIAQGDFDSTINSHRPDELGELSRSFDEMVLQLKSAFAGLRVLNQALVDSEHRIKQILETLPIGVSMHRSDGSIVYLNTTGRQLLDVPDEFPDTSIEAMPQTYHLYYSGSDRFYSADQLPPIRALRGEQVTVDDIEIRRNQHIIPLQVHSMPLLDSYGNVIASINTFQDITDRKMAEKMLSDYNRDLEAQVAERTRALQESEARNRAVLSAIPDLITIISGDGIYLDAIRYNSFLSLVPDTVNPIGKHMSELLPPEMVEQKLQAIHAALSTQTVQTYEQEVWIGDRQQYEEARVVPYGKNSVMFIIRDVTARRLAEKALRASEERLREIAQTVSQIFFARSATTGQFLYISPAYERIWNRSCESLYQDPDSWLEAVHPDDRPYVEASVKQQFQGHSVKRQYRMIRPDGSIRWISNEVTLIRDASGQPLRFVGFAEDITDRKRTEDALRQSEAQYRAMVEDQTELVCRFLPDGTLTFVNSTYCQYFGKQPEELIGQTFLPLIPEADQIIVQTNFASLSIENPFVTYEHRVILPSGEVRWQQWTDRAIFNEHKQLVEYHAVGRDITERKHAEAELRAQQQFLRNIIDVVPSCIFVKDRDGRYLVVNRAGAEMYGRSIDEILGKRDRDFNPDTAQVAQFLASNREVMATRQPKVIQAEALTNQHGETRWYKTVINPFIDAEGQVQGVIGSSTDITDFKRVEEEMRSSKEVAETASRTKSAFLANMSHELRTPLNAILGFTQLITRDRNLTPLQQEQLTIINRNGEYLLQLINDVLSISKIEAGRTTLEEHSFDLYALLDTLEGMFRLRADAKGLYFSCQRSIDVPQFIYADERKLRQIITNLLDNALKFTDRGSVTLSVRLHPPTPNSQLPTPLIHLLFDVTDTGVGIAATELSTVFDAFVQSESGRKSLYGTGLGLTISRRFVQLMGGEIQVTSEVGRGTSFQFNIVVRPVAADTVQVGHTSRRIVRLANPQTRYRILVADDTDTNRQLLVRWLSLVGFEVREASNGQEAIEQWQQFAPHLIWMDMRMPVMDGFEAVRQIRRQEQALGIWEPEELEHRIEQAEAGLPQYSLDRPVLPTIIIAVTAAVFEEEQPRILAVGCDDIVVKPCSEAIIFEKMAQYLHVEYLYDDKAAINQQNGYGGQGYSSQLVTLAKSTDPLLLSALQSMPTDWLMQLNYAARRANEREILQLLEAIPGSQSHLKEAIVELMQSFQLDHLIQLTQPPRSSKAYEC